MAGTFDGEPTSLPQRGEMRGPDWFRPDEAGPGDTDPDRRASLEISLTPVILPSGQVGSTSGESHPRTPYSMATKHRENAQCY